MLIFFVRVASGAEPSQRFWFPKHSGSCAGSSYEIGPGTASRTGWTGMDGAVEQMKDEMV